MSTISKLGRLILLAFLVTTAAQAAILFDITSQLFSNDPTQLGRLSRNGVQQDWTKVSGNSYSGPSAPTTTYVYNNVDGSFV